MIEETRDNNNDIIELVFQLSNGDVYKLCHYQDCCESVFIQDITGDINDIIGSPILMAEMVDNASDIDLGYDYYYKWTYYKLATIKGYVTLRWYGSSNGYYSVEVDFIKVNK